MPSSVAANRPPGWQPRSNPVRAHGGLNAAVSKRYFIASAAAFRQRDARGWKSLLTSYPPSGIEVCEPEEAEGDSRPAGWRAGRHAAGRIAAPWPLPLVTLIWYVR